MRFCRRLMHRISAPITSKSASKHCGRRLPACPAGGAMVNYLWELIEQNGPALCQDIERFAAVEKTRVLADDAKVVGPANRLVVAHTANVEPYVTFDTRQGPVLLDRQAVVQSF